MAHGAKAADAILVAPLTARAWPQFIWSKGGGPTFLYVCSLHAFVCVCTHTVYPYKMQKFREWFEPLKPPSGYANV